MKYYKELDWDSSVIQQELLAHADRLDFISGPVKTTFNNLELCSLLSACPALVEFLEITNFKAIKASFHIADSLLMNGIHIDDTIVDARINFPVLNCSTTMTEFYQVAPDSFEPNTLNNGVTYFQCVDPNPKLMASVSLTRPTVLAIKKPHCVKVTQEGLRRISLTLQVWPDPANLLLD